MTTQEFLAYLRSLDIKIWREGDQMRVNAPKGVLTPELRDEIAQRKEEILAFFDTTNPSAKENFSSISLF